MLLSVKDYAKKRGVSGVAVTRAMKKGKALINVENYFKQGRDWFLVESKDQKKINRGKIVVNSK